MTSIIHVGDCRDVLRTLPERSVQCVVSSPPYYSLRDYQVADQIGLEPTVGEYVVALVGVFSEVARVMRDDAVAFLNLGDSYGPGKQLLGVPWRVAFALQERGWLLRSDIVWSKLLMPNPMPESVTDRPTRSHEYLFLLSKRPRYFYDQDAIREDVLSGDDRRGPERMATGWDDLSRRGLSPEVGQTGHLGIPAAGRNKRSVWTVATQPFSSERLGLGETEHFAVFPPKLVEPCVLAGSAARACGVCGAPWRRVVERTSEATQPGNGKAGVDGWQRNDLGSGRAGMFETTSRTVGWEPLCAHDDDTGRSIVLDPFAGSGTVGVVCGWHGRDFIGIELNPRYAQMARERIALEGRPGGRPASHEPARVNGHPSLFDP